MIASLSNVWTWFDAAQTVPAPKPKRRGGPVLIGDILTARGNEPEFLIRWKADQRASDQTDRS